MNDKLVSFLFQTNAFRVSSTNKPFWLTSGLISPYFINTHFLYGNQTDAESLLNLITDSLANEKKVNIPEIVADKVISQYNQNNIYKTTIDTLISSIKENIDIRQIDYISGGERRDWFFSIIVAYLLEIPHITLFKDQTAVISSYDFKENQEITRLENKKVLHIADLLTKASSYEKYWIPAVQKLGSDIYWSTVIVDRLEGGTKLLKEQEIEIYSLIQLDSSLFARACELNIITSNQYSMLTEYLKDSYNYMRNFLKTYPEFLKESLNSNDSKTKQRANYCVDNNLYDL